MTGSKLCEDCPPVGYPTDKTRCLPCPRRKRDLILPLKAIYFDAIRDGIKTREFRLDTPYWRKRLEGRTYRHVVLLRGYPKGGGVEGETRLTREWLGYTHRLLQHKHFGPDPVPVFAIDVSTPATLAASVQS